MIFAILGPVVGNALLTVGQRVQDRWLDDFADSLGDKLGAAVRAVFVASRDPEAHEAIESAAAELDRQVEEHPALVRQLAKPPLPGAAGDATRIQQFADFLSYELGLVAGLRRPVALPGFFNGSSCVTVIDVRSPPSPLGDKPPLPAPKPLATAGVDPSNYVIYFAPASDRPRIWLIATANDSRRDELVGHLNESFWPAMPSTGDIEFTTFRTRSKQILDGPLGEGEYAQRLSTISRDEVSVLKRDAVEERVWYSITEPDGILLFRDALAELVAEHEEREGAWKRLKVAE